MITNQTNRREFIKTGAIGTAGITIGAMGFSAKSYAAIAGANERINVGVIGPDEVRQKLKLTKHS